MSDDEPRMTAWITTNPDGSETLHIRNPRPGLTFRGGQHAGRIDRVALPWSVLQALKESEGEP